MRLHRIRALLLKYWYFSRADLSRTFDLLYWPILGIIIFGFTSLYLQKGSSIPDLAVFLLGGLIVWILFERIQQDVAIFLLEDFWSRNIANMFTTPLTEAEMFTALMILGIIRGIITSIIMYVVALVAYSFNVINGNPAAVFFAIPLILFGWALGIIVSGMIFRYSPRIQVFAWSVSYLLQPIAAVYYPLASLPAVLQKCALFFPLAYTFEGYRSAYAGTMRWDWFAMGTALSLVYLLIGFWYFMQSVKAARKNGLLTQY